MAMTDQEAKHQLREVWPGQTQIWSREEDNAYWLRAQPGIRGLVGPRLELPGAGALRTQPDGLWITLGIDAGDTSGRAQFADCLVVESCGTRQNFSDKRSRYAARTTSLVLALPAKWLEGGVSVRAGATRKRRELLRGNLPVGEQVRLPVRHLRVLYALPNNGGRRSVYRQIVDAMVLEAHEYVCPQNALSQVRVNACRNS